MIQVGVIMCRFGLELGGSGGGSDGSAEPPKVKKPQIS